VLAAEIKEEKTAVPRSLFFSFCVPSAQQTGGQIFSIPFFASQLGY
jgi:hypothetical protein